MFEFTSLTLNPFALRRSRYNSETTTDITVVGKQPARSGRRVNTAPFMVEIKTLVAGRDSSRSRDCLTGIYSGDKWAGSRGRLLGGITQNRGIKTRAEGKHNTTLLRFLVCQNPFE